MLLSDPFPQTVTLSWYRPDLRRFPDDAVSVRELDVVGRGIDAPFLRPRLLGLRRMSLVRRQRFVVARYRSDRPLRLTQSRVEALLHGPQVVPWATVLEPSRG